MTLLKNFNTINLSIYQYIKGGILKKIVNVLDIEASGFRGYPIQIGAISVDQRKFNQYLIPHQEWVDLLEWDFNSQCVHNIEKEYLYQKGIDINDAARQLNDFFKNEDVFVDSHYDISWLDLLFDYSNVRRTFKMFIISDVCPSEFSDHWDIAFYKAKKTSLLKQHDALNDAILIQRAFTYIANLI